MSKKLPHPKVFIDNHKKRDIVQALLDSHEKLIELHKAKIEEMKKIDNPSIDQKIEMEKERLNVTNLTVTVESERNMIKEREFRIDIDDKNFEKELVEAKENMESLIEKAEKIIDSANPKAPFVREMDDMLDIYEANKENPYHQLGCYKNLKICVSNYTKLQK